MERQPTRRGFLAGGAALAASAALPADPARSAAAGTRTVPKSGEEIACVGLGSWITFNVGNDPVLLDSSAEVMRAFFEAGGRVIDSSPMYGSSQATIGYGLDRLGRPDGLFAADKVWTSSGSDGPPQIEQSRRAWDVPGFSLMQVHNLRAWQAHLPTLQEMKQAGRLRYVGITTSDGRRHDLLEEIMRSEPLDFVQLSYNMLDREVEQRILPLAADLGMGVVVNRPFRQGRLTEWLEGRPLPEWAGEIGASSWAQFILKFILSHPAVTVVIPATTRPDHARENVAASAGPLPDRAMRERMSDHVRALMSEWWTYRPRDFLLFSERVYWRLFELQNEAVWPLQAVALLLGAAMLVMLLRPRPRWSRPVAAALAAAWAFVGWSFLWNRYAPVNWAAHHAAALFLLEALLIGWAGAVRGGLSFAAAPRIGRIAGLALVGWALALHPLVSAIAGRSWKGAEILAIAPDPTAIATLGLLAATDPGRTRWLLAPVPALWCLASWATLVTMGRPEGWIPLAAAVAALAAMLAGRRSGAQSST